MLAFTADADVGDGAGLETFDGVVRKPIDPMDMTARIAMAVSGGEAQDEHLRASA